MPNKLQKILERLEQSRLISLKGDNFELSHDALANVIADRRSASEKALIEWAKLVGNKLQASIQSSSPDYLTAAQLAGLLPYEAKLELSKEERQFIENSRQENKRKSLLAKRRLQMKLGIALFVILVLVLAWSKAIQNKRMTNQEIVRNERIINGMHFYKENFALCVQKDSSGHLKYGFMDKKGKFRIPFEYDEAEHFDDYGFARVKVREKLFLIDTNNVKYRLAETVLALTDEVTALRLNEQDLEVIPEEVWQNLQLKILALRGNALTKIPEGLYNLKQLEILDLGENKLTEIPNEFAALSELKVLDLQQNHLENVVPSLTKLSNLEWLNLSNNDIKIIPAAMKQLLNLKVLDLSHNIIESIEEGLENIAGMELLNLYNNNLDSLPHSLVQQTDLVIHFGSHKMNAQQRKDNYANADKKDPLTLEVSDSVIDIPIFDSTERHIDLQEGIDSQKLEEQITKVDTTASNENLKNDKKKPKSELQQLVDGVVTLIEDKHFDWRFKLQPFKNKCKLIVMHSGRSEKDLIGIKKGCKIIFVSGFESRVFELFYEVRGVKINGRLAYINSCILENKQIEWMMKNTITQMQFLGTKAYQRYPYPVKKYNFIKWRQHVADFLDQNK